MDFLSRAGGRHCFILARDKNKKDQKNLRRKLVDYCPEQGDQKQAALKQKTNKVDRNAPIASKHLFSKRSAKMIDRTEKPEIPLKSAKRAARYNEFSYNDKELTHAKTSGTVTRDREKKH